MSSREIEALLAELSELLDTGSPSELTSFLLRRLRLAVAEPVLAQLPEPLERFFPLTTPVTDWLGFESGARFSLVERGAEPNRRERWSDRHASRRSRPCVLEAVASLGAHAEPLRARLLAHLEHASPDVPAWACTALASMAVDDLLAVRLATVFLRCAEQVPPFARDYHHAARALAPIWAARIEHPSEIVARRCIEALGTTREYGRAHLPALRALEAASHGALRRAAREAAERIEHPEPMFRPNQ